MPSLQGNFIRWVMRLRPNTPISIPKTRQFVERTTKWIPVPKQNTYQEESINTMPVLWVTPPNHSQQVVLYLHGGGYIVGSIHSEQVIAGNIALESGARVVAIGYRLAPEHPFPAGLEDALSAYRHLISMGIAPQQIIVCGLSAGGGLAMALLLKLKELGEPLPSGAILASPWLDLTGTSSSITANARRDSGLSWNGLLAPAVEAYVGDNDVRNPLISPVFADLSGDFPPVLIQVGDVEILLDDSRQLAQNLQNAGHDVKLSLWRGMIHGWHMYRMMPEARQAIYEMRDFIRQHQL
ncbi:MAG: alpha/beta hydrolase [Anaerolineae bacterium]|nr:alpha/beta hydrolase [Anaerolineae bacterium]